jgi:two-component system nitrogen regulation sensor histidine kinase NtrY
MRLINHFREIFTKGKWLFIFVLVFLGISIFFERQASDCSYSEKDVFRFQEVLHKKEIRLDSLMQKTYRRLSDADATSLFNLMNNHDKAIMEKQGLSVFVFENDSLKYWSDNIVIPPFETSDSLSQSEIVMIGNSVFMRKSIEEETYSIVGLILIRQAHPYENRFLENSFQKDFNLSPEVLILMDQLTGFPVYDLEEEYLFSVDFTGTLKTDSRQTFLSLFFYILAFFSFLLFIGRFIANSPSRIKNLVFLFSIPLLLGFYFFINFFRFPSIIFQLELFSADKFAASAFLPSLGDLMVIVIFLFFIMYNFYVNFIFKIEKLKRNSFLRFSLVALMMLISFLIYLGNAIIFKSLIFDSSISFETYKVFEISVYTFFGFFVLALLFVSFVLINDKILSVLYSTKSKREAGTFSALLIIFIFSVNFLPAQRILSWETTIFYSLISILIYYFRFFSKLKYRFSTFVLFVLLFSLFTVFEVVKYTNQKNISEMKIMAVNLSAEHDPVAELLFEEIDQNLKSDIQILALLTEPYLDFDQLYKYIQRKYFSGFWDKYDLQITVCNPEDSVYVSPPENSWLHCYNFFYETILKNGIQVPGSDFYYLDNLNGRISYFASLSYFDRTRNEVTLFIELDSRLISEGLGYPELLLEGDFYPKTMDFSYAKYNKNKLITSSGDFAYSTNSKVYSVGKDGFEYVKYDGYDHVIYNLDKSNSIVVSYPSVFWVDILISFSYLFSFYFILLILLLSASQLSPFTMKIVWNFKNKIQLAMTALLFFSVLFFGIGTVYFSIKQYQSRHFEILHEKIQSVYVELMHKLEYEEDLHDWSSESYYDLNALLQKFSNVFYSDINLYDEDGLLLASSRPEIFELGLIGSMMNSDVYKEMAIFKRSEYIHNERIGKLKYLSAYVPFVNSENKLLAYLNLPYFTRQNELTREITNLVVAIINIIVLLSLLSFVFSLFLSNTITLPLRLIQQKIGEFSLSEKNEKIEYRGKDEIGSLIDEYNIMIDKLQKSAELLARSERETAWREMAKQIAHEIKNPLTPMKLGIQHLQRSYNERSEDWETQVNKISKTLIDQIDTLSSIATEFSNFAKMPVAKNTQVDLVEKLKNAIGLYGDYEGSQIELNLNGIDSIFVFADKEQLSRVFGNLIKNAIQSVPENRTGKIEVELSIRNKFVIVAIRDNGKGIPDTIRDKLFQPNFTTKTSGMGLGLAIVKNIINNIGGNIYYETELNKGTNFYVELPVLDI